PETATYQWYWPRAAAPCSRNDVEVPSVRQRDYQPLFFSLNLKTVRPTMKQSDHLSVIDWQSVLRAWARIHKLPTSPPASRRNCAAAAASWSATLVRCPATGSMKHVDHTASTRRNKPLAINIRPPESKLPPTTSRSIPGTADRICDTDAASLRNPG